MKKISTKLKFQLGTGGILLIFCTLIAVVTYYYLKKLATEDIYRETEIFISTADATRTYVKDVLRPKVSQLLTQNEFIPHAMSTSFVGREIMNRLKKRFPVFHYKRAAANPTNPLNQADKFERSMLKWFDEHRDSLEWHGLIQKNNRSYYTRMRAIYAEALCLRCHGRPQDAPAKMIALYGSKGGFDYKVGDVVAADTIYIPVDVTFTRIKEAAWLVFLIALLSLFALGGLFYLLFNRTVVSELKGLLTRFRGISAAGDHREDMPENRTGDEFVQMKAAFENVAVDLQQAHDELKSSESKYRLLFETSRDAILIIDADTRLLDINASGLGLFGFKDRSEAISIETFYQLFWDTRDAEAFYETIKSAGFVQGLEVAVVDRHGKKLMVAVSATARVDDNGRFSGIDATLRDITEKRRMEKYLARTEKLAAIGQLASGVAHEINNPLGVIKCYAGLIAKDKKTDGQVKQDIGIIQKHTEQCKTVVEALLNFARVSDTRKADIDLQACIEEVLSVLEHQFNKAAIEVRRNYLAENPVITVDARKMQQVFMNLFLNASQAMPQGGELTITTEFQNGDSRLAIHVADTGQGIAEKHVDRIFDPFFTTKDAGKGTGLGLSVSYGIVQQHGGSIEVKSSARGSTFTVLLPME